MSLQDIFERERSAMRFRDLPAQHEPDSRTARLGGEKRDE